MTITDYFFDVLNETQLKLAQYREAVAQSKNKEQHEQHLRECDEIIEAAANATNCEEDRQLFAIKSAITAMLNVQDKIAKRLSYLKGE